MAPGLINTPIYGEAEASEEFKANLEKGVLFPKRLGTSEELASMVVEPCSGDGPMLGTDPSGDESGLACRGFRRFGCLCTGHRDRIVHPPMGRCQMLQRPRGDPGAAEADGRVAGR